MGWQNAQTFIAHEDWRKCQFNDAAFSDHYLIVYGRKDLKKLENLQFRQFLARLGNSKFRTAEVLKKLAQDEKAFAAKAVIQDL